MGVGVSVGVGFGVDVQSLFRVQGLGVLWVCRRRLCWFAINLNVNTGVRVWFVCV